MVRQVHLLPTNLGGLKQPKLCSFRVHGDKSPKSSCAQAPAHFKASEENPFLPPLPPCPQFLVAPRVPQLVPTSLRWLSPLSLAFFSVSMPSLPRPVSDLPHVSFLKTFVICFRVPLVIQDDFISKSLT